MIVDRIPTKIGIEICFNNLFKYANFQSTRLILQSVQKEKEKTEIIGE